MERGMEHGMERGTDVKCPNKPNKRALIGAGASKPTHTVVGIDSESREMVADDNRRASDN